MGFSTVLRFSPFFGIAGFAVVVLLRLISGDTDDFADTMLTAGLTWLIGVTGFVGASGHMFYNEPVARSIGWLPSRQWQWEVGLANLALGVLGIIAATEDRPFQLATIIAFSVFMLGAAAGHVREMAVEKNFSPGNAGPVFFFDIAIPLGMIALYLAAG